MLGLALKALTKKVILVFSPFAFIFLFATSCSSKLYESDKSFIGESQIDDIQSGETPTRNIYKYGYLDLPPNMPLPIIIYTTKPNRYLVGNYCAMEYMMNRGYLYVSKDDYPNKQVDGIILWFKVRAAELKVFSKNGPGWKNRLRKQLKQCKSSSGDFVG